jgi:hypothetical protein
MKHLFILFGFICIFCVGNQISAQEVKINHGGNSTANGTKRMDDEAKIWEDLRVPLSSANKKNSTTVERGIPFESNVISGSPIISWFAPSGTDEMYFVAQLPHSWKEGTTIYPHIHWIPSETGSTDTESNPTVPRWGLEYAWLNIGETFSAYTTIYGTTTSTSEVLVANRQYLTFLGSIDGNTDPIKKISSMLICRIFRDGDNAADNFAGYAGALGVDFHYEVNTKGNHSFHTK